MWLCFAAHQEKRDSGIPQGACDDDFGFLARRLVAP